jgi:putative restriction endonuclease
MPETASVQSKLHDSGDAHLIGIEPDYRIHVSHRLLEIHDGPFLKLGLKGIAGQVIELPRRSVDRPDRERLAIRFEQLQESHIVSTAPWKRGRAFVPD